MGDPFAIFRTNVAPDTGDELSQKLQKPDIALAEIARLLGISSLKATAILNKITPTQGVTKKKTGVGSVFTISNTGAMRLIDLAREIPEESNSNASIDGKNIQGDILFFGELMTLSKGRLSQPIWAAMIKSNRELFVRKDNKGAYGIKREDLGKFLELIEPTDRARSKII